MKAINHLSHPERLSALGLPTSRRVTKEFRTFLFFMNDTPKSMRQIRDVITSSVSFTFRENEFAADNKASLPFQSLSTIFIFVVFS